MPILPKEPEPDFLPLAIHASQFYTFYFIADARRQLLIPLADEEAATKEFRALPQTISTL